MAIPVSTVPAVKKAITAAIATAVGSDPDTLVIYGQPKPGMPNDVISVGNVTREVVGSAMVGSGGAGWLEESYQVEVRISCFRDGEPDDATEIDARLYALIALVETAVRNDPSLGQLVVVSRPIRSRTGDDWNDEHLGRIAEAYVYIECRARI